MIYALAHFTRTNTPYNTVDIQDIWEYCGAKGFAMSAKIIDITAVIGLKDRHDIGIGYADNYPDMIAAAEHGLDYSAYEYDKAYNDWAMADPE